MNTTLKLLLMPFLLSVLLTGCFRQVIEFGNKNVEEETRVIPDFSSISSSGSFDVFFEYSDTSEVRVVAESNLLTYVETAVFNDELRISTPSFVNIRPNYTIEVYVKGPYVDYLKLSGSGTIVAVPIHTRQLSTLISGSGEIKTDFFGKELFTKVTGSGKIDIYAECEYAEAVITGSGDIYLEGFTDDFDCRISGSGRIRGYEFPTYNTNITISGSGNTYVNVEDKMTATISGSGNIYYIGSPKINSSITGTGRLINRN